MNIYNYLKQDHLKVSKLFEAITSAKQVEQRASLFEELKKELLLHSHAEDATFYSALRKHKDTKKIVEHAKEEHQEVEEYINKMANLSIESENWLAAFEELRHAVTHHVKEEEDDMFAKAKEVLSEDQEKQLAIDMEQLKSELV